MVDFKQWLESVAGRKITSNEPLVVKYVDLEDDWEIADQVDMIAKKVLIRPSSVKQVTFAAFVGEQVVGGVYSTIYRAGPGIEETQVYDFDIVVDPQWQGYQNVGLKLIDDAIYDAKERDCNMIQAHVVNPRLAVVLSNKYGFEGMPSHWDGKNPINNYSTILYKYI